MENSKKFEQRAYIKSRLALNETALAIHADLVKIHGRSAYSYMTVNRWKRHFKQGHTSISDETRSGRPITATNRVNLRILKELIDDDPFISTRDLEDLPSLSHTTILTIIFCK